MADSSQLIPSPTLIAQIACWQFDTLDSHTGTEDFFWTIECWKKDLGALETFVIARKKLS